MSCSGRSGSTRSLAAELSVRPTQRVPMVDAGYFAKAVEPTPDERQRYRLFAYRICSRAIERASHWMSRSQRMSIRCPSRTPSHAWGTTRSASSWRRAGSRVFTSVVQQHGGDLPANEHSLFDTEEDATAAAKRSRSRSPNRVTTTWSRYLRRGKLERPPNKEMKLTGFRDGTAAAALAACFQCSAGCPTAGGNSGWQRQQ
jgi:hypothetical protein